MINSGNIKVVRTTEVEFRVLLSGKHYAVSHHIKLKPFESTFGGLFLLKTALYECRHVKLLQRYMLLGFNIYGCQVGTVKCKFLSGVCPVSNDFQDIYASLKHVSNHFLDWLLLSSFEQDWLAASALGLWWLTRPINVKLDLWLQKEKSKLLATTGTQTATGKKMIFINAMTWRGHLSQISSVSSAV